jgi:hypothetical protein
VGAKVEAVPAIDKPAKTAAPRGRPSKFTDAVAAEICERLGKGEPLAVICRDAYMPKVQTVSDWRNRDEGFSVSIARAREEGFDMIAAECLKIADTPLIGVKTTVGTNGIVETREDMLAHRRLQIETRLKLLAKWDPSRYGDKIDVNSNQTGPIRIMIGGNVDPAEENEDPDSEV